jgi:hypothetical protein
MGEDKEVRLTNVSANLFYFCTFAWLNGALSSALLIKRKWLFYLIKEWIGFFTQLRKGGALHSDLSIDQFHLLPLFFFSSTQKEFVYTFVMLAHQQQRKVLQSSVKSSWKWTVYRVSKDHRRYLLFVILNCAQLLQFNYQRSLMCEEEQGSTVRPDLFES